MHIMKKGWIASAVVLAGVAVSASMTAPPVQAEPKPECELAAEWVAAHRDQLPATLREISEFPVAYRRAIAAALPVEAQMGL